MPVLTTQDIIKKPSRRIISTQDIIKAPIPGVTYPTTSPEMLEKARTVMSGVTIPEPRPLPQAPFPSGTPRDIRPRGKGPGYFGILKRPDGNTSTELSIGVEFDGKETEIPSLVPTLTGAEIKYLLAGNKPTKEIVQKAVDHAKQRIAKGKDVFAQKGEQKPVSTEAGITARPEPSFFGRIKEDIAAKTAGYRGPEKVQALLGVESKAKDLIKRLGKNIINSFSEIGESVISSPFSPVGISEEIVKPYKNQAAKELSQSGFTGNPAEAQQLINQRAKDLAAADIVPKLKTGPAETISEKATDVVSGLATFIAQLAITKKILPKGTPDPIVWEVQNQLAGGLPGHGAAVRSGLGYIGKIPTSSIVGKVAKTAAESGLFAGITAAEGGKGEDIIISALVPVVFNGWNFAKQKSYIESYRKNLETKAINSHTRRLKAGMSEVTSNAHLKADMRMVENAVAKAKQTIYRDDAFAPAREKWQGERKKALDLIATGKPKNVRKGNDILDFLSQKQIGTQKPIKQQIKEARAATKAIAAERMPAETVRPSPAMEGIGAKPVKVPQVVAPAQVQVAPVAPEAAAGLKEAIPPTPTPQAGVSPASEARGEGKPLVKKPFEKKLYTSIPQEWVSENTLVDWGKKGLRAKGNRAISVTGQKARKSFVWSNEFEPVATRLPQVIKAAKTKTEEIFRVSNPRGEDYWLVPKKVMDIIRKELPAEAFKRMPKPERTPKQQINDFVNSGERHGASPDQIGEAIQVLVAKNGLTKEDLSPKVNGYIKEYEDAKASGTITEGVQEGVGKEIRPAEEELERRAIQEEDLAADIGDFLDGITEAERESPEGLYGQKLPPILKGGAVGKQAVAWSPEDYKTEQAKLEDEAKRLDIEGQMKIGEKPPTESVQKGKVITEQGRRIYVPSREEWKQLEKPKVISTKELQASIGASKSPVLDIALQRAAMSTQAKYVVQQNGKWINTKQPPPYGDYYIISKEESVYVEGEKKFADENEAVRAARYIAKNTKKPVYIWQETNNYKISNIKPKVGHVQINPQGPGLTKEEQAILGTPQKIAEAQIAQEEKQKVGYKMGREQALREAGKKLDMLKAKIRMKNLDVKDLQNELYNAVKASSMSPAKLKSILGMIKNIRPERGYRVNAKILAKAILRASEYVDDENRRIYKRQILKELAKTKVKKKRGIPRGKYTAEVQRELDKIRARLGGDRDTARTKIIQNIQAFHGGTMPHGEMMLRNRELNLTSLRGMTSQELEYVLKEIQSLKESGKYIRQAKDEQRAERINQIKDRMYQIITSEKGLKEGTLSLPSDLLEKKPGVTERLINWNLAWDNLLDKLSKFDKTSKPYESDINKFGDIVHDSERNESGGVEKWINEINENYERIFGKGLKGLKAMSKKRKIGTFKNLDGEEITLILTGEQLVKKYLEMQDPTLDATFEGGIRDDGTKWGMRWTTEIRNAVENILTDKEKEWAQYHLDFYQKYYPTVNKVFKQIYGVDLPYNPFYSPIGRDVDSPDIEDVLIMKEAARFASTTNKSLKSRVGSTIPLQFNDADSVLINHIIRMEHFKNWSENIRDLRSVFSDKKIRKAIKQYHGKNILDHIDLLVDQMAKGGVDQMLVHNILDTIRKNFTTGVLGIKPIIALKQIPSVVAYTSEMSFSDFVVGIADFWTNPVRHARELAELSPGLRDRWGKGFERDIRFAMNKGYSKTLAQKGNMRQWFFALIRTGDKLATVQGSWAKYRAAIKEGMPKEQAIKEAEKATDRTQPTSKLSTLAKPQRFGSFWKLLTMFQNQPNKYFRIVNDNIRNFRYGRGSRPKALANIFIAWALLPMLFQWIADAFQFKKKKQIMAGVLGPLATPLVLGQLAKQTVGWFMGEPYDYESTPVESVATKTKIAISKTRKFIREAKDPSKDVDMNDLIFAIESLAEAGGMIAGIPTPYLVQTERSIRKVINQEDIKGRIGWRKHPTAEFFFSPYSLKAENKIDAMSIDEIRLEIRKNTYNRSYKRKNGKIYPAGYPHEGKEQYVGELKAKLESHKK